MKTTILFIVLTIISAMAQDEGGKVLPANGSNWVAITPEMEAVLKADPCTRLLERINAKAKADPLWGENYALAHYTAFVDVYGQYAIELLKKKGLLKQ